MKRKIRGNLLHRLGLALGLVALQVLLFSTTALAQVAGTETARPPDASNIVYIILIAVVFAILATGLGYVILRLTKDSG